MIVWCACPFVSSVLNGLGAYDGMSIGEPADDDLVFSPLPGGRLYLTDAEGLRELAWGVIVGGVCLIPLCFLEMKMSPIMSNLVYGFGALAWAEGSRYGFYRPRLFLRLSTWELGLWMRNNVEPGGVVAPG